MDRINSEDRDLSIDLESGQMRSDEGTSQGIGLGNRQGRNFLNSVASGLLGFNGSVGVENRGNSYSNLELSEVAAENVQVLTGNNSGGEESEEHIALVGKKLVKENHKKAHYKRASKPPRPPKGPSLDAADMKLVKEISTIAMKKRARTVHLKALRKSQEAESLAAAASSSSVPSSSNVFAMVITILFFLVILYQGFFSGGSSPSVSFEGSPEPALAENSMISVQFYNNPSANDVSGPGSQFPNSAEQYFG